MQILKSPGKAKDSGNWESLKAKRFIRSQPNPSPETIWNVMEKMRKNTLNNFYFIFFRMMEITNRAGSEKSSPLPQNKFVRQ